MKNRGRMFLIFVTSAGVNSLGIVSAAVWFGAIPNADILCIIKTIRTHIRTGQLVLLCW